MATPTSLPATFTAGQVLTAAQMNDLRGAFRILQVVSTTKTDTYSESIAASSVSTSNVTGFEATITPSDTNSKILVMVSVTGSRSSGVANTAGVLYRDSTAVGVGASDGSRTQISAAMFGDQADYMGNLSFHFLDAPSTTSSITYGWRLYNPITATRTMYVNRRYTDTDASSVPRAASTITVMEVSA